MVATKAALRRCLLPGSLLSVVGCWACLLCLALPALAQAEGEESPPAVCPAGGLEAGEAVEPQLEVRELRNDLALVCAVVAERLDQLKANTAGLRPELEAIKSNTDGLGGQLTQLDLDLVQLHHDLSPEAGLGVNVVGQAGPVQVEGAGGTVEVTNQPDVAAVGAAVHEGTDTGNQNLWALAGLFVGFLALVVVWKLVRP